MTQVSRGGSEGRHSPPSVAQFDGTQMSLRKVLIMENIAQFQWKQCCRYWFQALNIYVIVTNNVFSEIERAVSLLPHPQGSLGTDRIHRFTCQCSPPGPQLSPSWYHQEWFSKHSIMLQPRPQKLLHFTSKNMNHHKVYIKHLVCVCVCVLRHAGLFSTPWTVACQGPPSMKFPRQEYWSGQLFPSPEDLQEWSLHLLHRRRILYQLSHMQSISHF